MKYKVPEGMLKAAKEAWCDLPATWGAKAALHAGVQTAVGWLSDDVLHPRNVEFHRAILAAERERFPGSDQDLNIISRRVDFEYGVSFARNYIRDLFAPEPEPNFDEVWNALTVEINRVGMRKATEILRSQAGEK